MSNVWFSFGSGLNFTAGDGVYVYATVFAGGAAQEVIPLIVDGTNVHGLIGYTLPSRLVSGNIVITMQETHTTSGTVTPFIPTLSTTFNDLASATNAATNNYRYDTVELTLKGKPGDAADLTNIVQFGMPIELSANGETRGFLPNFHGTPTGQALVTAINGLSPTGFQDGTWAAGSTPFSPSAVPPDQRETYMGGNNGNGAGSANKLNHAADWNAYVQELDKIDQHIRIANYFGGVTADPATNTKYVAPYFVYYDVSYDKTSGVVTMSPVNDSAYDALLKSLGSNVQAMGSAIKVAATLADTGGSTGYNAGDALTENIYMQSGNITILPDPSDPSQTYTQLYAANNQYAAPVKFLLSGFEAGFWGGRPCRFPTRRWATRPPPLSTSIRAGTGRRSTPTTRSAPPTVRLPTSTTAIRFGAPASTPMRS